MPLSKRTFIFLKDLIYSREREREREAEKQTPHGEPHVGLDPGTPGPCPGPKAGTKPLIHPGIPCTWFLFSNQNRPCDAFVFKTPRN